jgi:hypothetical protein
MNIYYAVKDIEKYSNKDINILKQYYNISDNINLLDSYWIIAYNIHSNKKMMAPDKVWIKYNNQLTPLLPANILENNTYKQLFLDADPDPKKKNLEWIITSFISGGFSLDQLLLLKQSIIKFNKLKEKDVLTNNLVDFGGLNGFTRNNKTFLPLLETLNNYPDVENIEYKYNIIQDDNNVKIIEPLTEITSCKYGANTKWCTSGKNNNQYSRYTKRGRIYVLIPKNPIHNGEKYQLFISYNWDNKIPKNYIDDITYGLEFNNELDEPVNMYDFLELHPYMKDNILIKYYNIRKQNYDIPYEEYIKNPIDYKRNGKFTFNNIVYTYKDGELHSYNDEPAIEYITGEKYWYKNGKKHRDNNLPAIETSDSKEWYQDGKLHRSNDLPAVINSFSQIWYTNGVLNKFIEID